MADEKYDFEPTDSKKAGLPYPGPSEQDWILSQLVALVNTFNVEIGVTLYSGSGLISGTLISADKYHQEMVSLLKKADPAPDSSDSLYGAIADYFEKTAEGYKHLGRNNDNIFSVPAHYIHLRNARTFLGGDTIIPGEGGVLWRGRLSQISGFAMGAMAPSD